jgi:hypothetical protein
MSAQHKFILIREGSNKRFLGSDENNNIFIDIYWSDSDGTWWVEIRSAKRPSKKIALYFLKSLHIAEARINEIIRDFWDKSELNYANLPFFQIPENIRDVITTKSA